MSDNYLLRCNCHQGFFKRSCVIISAHKAFGHTEAPFDFGVGVANKWVADFHISRVRLSECWQSQASCRIGCPTARNLEAPKL